jgi:hypothetical protein
VAGFAGGRDLDLDLDILAVEGFVEADFQIIAQIGAATRLLAPAAATKGAAENRLENIADVAEFGALTAKTTATGAAILESGMAEAVIGGALLGSFRQS